MTRRLLSAVGTGCVIAVLVGIGLLAGARTASAAVCDSSYAANVQHASGCTLGSTDVDSASQVNADNIFGISSWVFIGQDNTDFTSSTFLIPSDLWTTQGYDHAMLVLQNANGVVPATYVAYLLDFGTTGSISWTSPFTTKSGHTRFETLYAATTANTPIPAGLPLLGSGLAFLAWVSRRRRAAS